MDNIRISISSLGLLALIGLSDCAYYNTFYNSQKYFQEARKEFNTLPDEKVNVALRKKFDTAIEKANRVLVSYPESRWADDALYIIALSNYYKGDYSIARRKFEEFSSSFPRSNLYPEILIWYGKNLWKLREKEQAFYQWKKALALIRDDQLLADLYFAIAEIHFNNAVYDSALYYYRKTTQVGKNIEIAADAQFRIAETYLTQNQVTQAIDNLKLVSRYNPAARIKDKMQILLAKIYRESGRYEEAIELINTKLNDPTNEKIWGDLELQLALIYRIQGDYQTAISRLTQITEKYKNKPISAEAYFNLAELNLTTFHDYSKAQSQYEAVLKEDPKSPYVTEARNKIAEIKRYYNLQKKYDGTLKQIQELERERLTRLALETDSALTGSSAEEIKKALEKQALSNKKSIDTAAIFNEYFTNLYEMAEVLYYNFKQTDSAFFFLNKIAENESSNPLREKALYALYFMATEQNLPDIATDYENTLLVVNPQSSYLAVIHNQNPVTTEDPETAPERQYLEAESLQITDVDSAVSLYEKIVHDYPRTPYAEKAVLSLIYLFQHHLFDWEKTRQWYEYFIDNYPTSTAYHANRLAYEQLKRVAEPEKSAETPIAAEQSLEEQKSIPQSAPQSTPIQVEERDIEEK